MNEQFINNNVVPIPTLLGRLVYASSLRDINKGTYYDPALEGQPEEEIHAFLTSLHRTLFYEWLNLSLEEQLDDLMAYLRELSGDPARVIEAWRTTEPFALYIPAGAGRGDQELFLTDLRIIVDLLRVDEPSYSTSTP
jgi:hypothetical protein